jgi:hypothetical protein
MKRDHSTATYEVRSTTKITENGGAGDAIRVDDFATIQAAAAAPTVALAITFDPNELVRFYGRVIDYTSASRAVAGSITLEERNGSDVTFASTTTTNIMATDGSAQNVAVGDYAIVRAAATSKSVALSISFSTHPLSRRHLTAAHRRDDA